MKKITKEELIKEFKEIGKDFKNPLEITRNDYRKVTKYHSAYDNYFKTFSDFKKEVFEITEEDEKKFDLEKKVLILENKNRELEKEKEMLLKSSISEDTIIEDFEKLRLKEILPQKINLTNIKLSSNKEAVFVVSDIHCGEVVKAEEAVEKKLNKQFDIIVKLLVNPNLTRE